MLYLGHATCLPRRRERRKRGICGAMGNLSTGNNGVDIGTSPIRKTDKETKRMRITC